LLPSAGRCAWKTIPGSDAPRIIGGRNARRSIRGRKAGFARRKDPSRGVMFCCEPTQLVFLKSSCSGSGLLKDRGLGVAGPWFERAKESGPQLNGSLSIGENHEAIASRFRPGTLSE